MSAGVVLGVFFIVTGLHNIVFGPSISALSGYDGAIVRGVLAVHLLRPRNTQLLVSVTRWTPLAAVEVLFGAVVWPVRWGRWGAICPLGRSQSSSAR